MERHVVWLCVCCVLFTVTYGQFTRSNQRNGTISGLDNNNGSVNIIFPESKDEDNSQPTTVRPRPIGSFWNGVRRIGNNGDRNDSLNQDDRLSLDDLETTVRPRPLGSFWNSVGRNGNNGDRNDSLNQDDRLSLDDLINDVFAQSANETATTPLSLTESINVCGSSSWSLVQGGEAVQNTEFPWLGGLFARARNMYLCTVNLVSAKHAVTAAHCFASTNADNFGIRWGHPRISQSGYTSLSSVTVHPGYKQSTLHDVAVVALSNPVTFTLSLKPICLWRTTWSPDKGITGTVAGFGPNYEDLTKVELPIVTQETCKASNVFFHFATSEFTFCAGTRNREVGPCKGDSGAGYMQWVQDRYYLRGLVSHSLSANGNCNLQEYIIFSDLSKEVDWIVGIVS